MTPYFSLILGKANPIQPVSSRNPPKSPIGMPTATKMGANSAERIAESKNDTTNIKNGKINKGRDHLPTRHIFMRANKSLRPCFPSTIRVITMLDKMGAANINIAMSPLSDASMDSPRKYFGPATRILPTQAIPKAIKK